MFVSVQVGQLLIVLALRAAAEVRTKTVPLSVLNRDDTLHYPNCDSLLHVGYSHSGTYLLHIDGEPVVTHCDLNAYAFMTVLERTSGSIHFNRTFEEYEYGFKDKSGHNLWAGLYPIHHKIHEVITRNPFISITMTDWDGKFRSCKYDKFYVSNKDSGYRLTIGEFQEMGPGKIGDMLKSNNGAEFYAIDHPDSNECVSGMHGGWWYKGSECAEALPTGRYYEGGYYDKTGPKWDGIFWEGARGDGYSFKTMSILLIWN